MAGKKKAKAKAKAKPKVKEVLIDGPTDEEQVEAPAAIVDEPVCYNRQAGSGNNVTGNSQHMTVAEAQKKFGGKKKGN